MAVQIGSPFTASFTKGYVATAAEIRDTAVADPDGGVGKTQSAINADVRLELADLGLTQEELEAIINEVDLDGIRIIATPQTGQSGDDFAIYRFTPGDVEREENNSDICFSKPDGTKYYLYVEYPPKEFDSDPTKWGLMIEKVLYLQVSGQSDSGYQVKKVENIPQNS